MFGDIRDMNSEALLKMHEINQDDLMRVQQFSQFVIPKLDRYIELFYQWAEELPEFHIVFTSEEILAHAQEEQKNYWRHFFSGVIDEKYLEAKRHIGKTHARIGLSLPSYMAAMNYSNVLLTKTLYENELSDDEYIGCLSSITKLLHLDVTIVSDTYSRIVNEQIAQQSKALLQMSTPVTQIWEDILLLPMVGIIDSRRAQDVMTTALNRIYESRARVFIMDISGVAIVDSAVANHLIKITKSTGLMGCTSLLSGMSPAIAQTMVNLGFDVGEISTSATLHDALLKAFKIIGKSVS